MALGGDGGDIAARDGEARHDTRRAARLAVVGIAIVLAALFMAQNNDEVELTFLFVDVTTRVWVGMLATLVLGALLGQAAEVLWNRRRRRADRA